MSFTELIDLASERLGGTALAANDEFFAPKENLLKESKPIFIEDKYTDRGKWMDGWETRRRRTPGFAWCIIKLGLPGVIRGVLVDTSHFKGNYPEQCSIEVCSADRSAGAEQLDDPSTQWIEVLPKTPLKGDFQNFLKVESSRRSTHIRFKIFPDGGVARLRVYGEVVPDRPVLDMAGEMDLASVENGGLVIASSDMFFGSRQNLIMPGRAAGMRDGWETRRRRGPGHDWVIIRLGSRGTIRRVEVDTGHFKGNFPESCSLEGCNSGSLLTGASFAAGQAGIAARLVWREVLPHTSLEADTQHFFQSEIKEVGPVAYVRFNIFPDGGVSRLRIMGSAGRAGGPPG